MASKKLGAAKAVHRGKIIAFDGFNRKDAKAI